VIGLFILANLIRIGHQSYRRRRTLKLAQASSEKTEFASSSSARPGAATRSVNALLTATNKAFSWREVTIALWWKVSAGEIFWSAMYTFVVLLLGLIYRTSPPPFIVLCVVAGSQTDGDRLPLDPQCRSTTRPASPRHRWSATGAAS